MNIWGRNNHLFWSIFPLLSSGLGVDAGFVCTGVSRSQDCFPDCKAQELSSSSGVRSSQAGLGSRLWEEKCHCDLPRSLPSAGTVMLQGNCWPSMSVSGPLPRSVSQPRRRPYLEQLGWAGPAGRRAGEESGHDGETSLPGLARDARRCRVESCGATG